MLITILTIGSRGDVQPFIALGRGLKEAGHQVRLATHSNFKSMILEEGLEFALISGNPQDFFESDAGQAIMKTRNPLELNTRIHEGMDPVLASIQTECWQACQESSLVIACGLALWASDITERLQIPCCFALLQPAAPTREFPISTFPPGIGRLGGFFNRLSYTVVFGLMSRFFRGPVNKFRQSTLNLQPSSQSFFSSTRQRQIPLLSAVSPSVVPPPTDWTELDHMTGYWFLDKASEFEPPQSLQNFLADGPPPVYVGFGSMGGEESHQTIEIALEALKQTGQRGIFLTGWSGLDEAELPSNIYKVSSIPHDWLFPQMSCIIHHGGAGTTASAFRAGVPAVIIPFLADQPFWGDRAYKLGVSPAPLDRKKLTASQLAKAISLAVNDSAMHERAYNLGEKIRSENGVQYTVDLIEKMLKDEIPSTPFQSKAVLNQ